MAPTMAEAGSFADRVKQQADIVRVVGEYVRLKKSGQNFTRAVSVSSGKDAVVCRASSEADLSLLRVRRGRRRFQIRDGDGEDYVSGSRPRRRGKMRHRRSREPRERSPEERNENQQRTSLVEMHREAAAFFAQQLNGTPEGQRRESVSARPRARLRSHGALRHWLRAIGRRSAAARV